MKHVLLYKKCGLAGFKPAIVTNNRHSPTLDYSTDSRIDARLPFSSSSKI